VGLGNKHEKNKNSLTGKWSNKRENFVLGGMVSTTYNYLGKEGIGKKRQDSKKKDGHRFLQGFGRF